MFQCGLIFDAADHFVIDDAFRRRLNVALPVRVSPEFADTQTMAESARRQFDAVFATALQSGALYALAFDK
jgi:hypothetical protein